MKITGNNHNQDQHDDNANSNYKIPKGLAVGGQTHHSDDHSHEKRNTNPWVKRLGIGLAVVAIGGVAWIFTGGNGSKKPTPKKPTTTQMASSSSSTSSSSSSSSAESYKLPKFKQKNKNTVAMKPVVEKFMTAFQVQDNPKSMDYDKRQKLMQQYASKSAVETLLPQTTIDQYKQSKQHYIVETRLTKPIEIQAVDGNQTGEYMVTITYQTFHPGSNFKHNQIDKYAINTDHNKIVEVHLLKSILK